MSEHTDDEIRSLVDTLSTVELFSGLDEDTLSQVAAKTQQVAYKQGDILCTEGEPGDRMFIVHRGEVAVLKRGHDGKQTQLTVLRAGEFAGELTLFDKSNRNATLQARYGATILELSHDDMQQLIGENPQLSRALLASISRHLRSQNWVVANLQTRE
jgi:CRP-like cAMP-binding protein